MACLAFVERFYFLMYLIFLNGWSKKQGNQLSEEQLCKLCLVGEGLLVLSRAEGPLVLEQLC